MTSEIECHLTAARDLIFVEGEPALEPDRILFREILHAVRLTMGFVYDDKDREKARLGDKAERHAARLLLTDLKDGTIRARSADTSLPIHVKRWCGYDAAGGDWDAGEIHPDGYGCGRASILPYVDRTDAIKWIKQAIQKIDVGPVEPIAEPDVPPEPIGVPDEPPGPPRRPSDDKGRLAAIDDAVAWWVARGLKPGSAERVEWAQRNLGLPNRNSARRIMNEADLPATWRKRGNPGKRR